VTKHNNITYGTLPNDELEGGDEDVHHGGDWSCHP